LHLEHNINQKQPKQPKQQSKLDQVMRPFRIRVYRVYRENEPAEKLNTILPTESVRHDASKLGINLFTLLNTLYLNPNHVHDNSPSI
jgi:hypothetical protein